MLDGDRRILLVNPALRATAARSGPEVEGNAPLELIRNAELQTILDRAFAGGDPGLRRDRDQRAHAAPPAGPRQPRSPRLARNRQARAAGRVRRRDARSGGSRRCARTSSPTSRTSCARRSRPCARRSRRCATRCARDPAASAALHRHHRPQRPAPGRAGRGPARSVAHRVAGSTAPTRSRCRCAPLSEQVMALLRRARSRRRGCGWRNEVPADLPPPRARPAGPRAGAHQPDRQRRQVLPGRRLASLCARAERQRRRGRAARRGRRHRPRHRAAPPAAPVRALLPRRQRPLARHGRHRARACRSSSTWSRR